MLVFKAATSNGYRKRGVKKTFWLGPWPQGNYKSQLSLSDCSQ